MYLFFVNFFDWVLWATFFWSIWCARRVAAPDIKRVAEVRSLDSAFSMGIFGLELEIQPLGGGSL